MVGLTACQEIIRDERYKRYRAQRRQEGKRPGQPTHAPVCHERSLQLFSQIQLLPQTPALTQWLGEYRQRLAERAFNMQVQASKARRCLEQGESASRAFILHNLMPRDAAALCGTQETTLRARLLLDEAEAREVLTAREATAYFATTAGDAEGGSACSLLDGRGSLCLFAQEGEARDTVTTLRQKYVALLSEMQTWRHLELSEVQSLLGLVVARLDDTPPARPDGAEAPFAAAPLDTATLCDVEEMLRGGIESSFAYSLAALRSLVTRRDLPPATPAAVPERLRDMAPASGMSGALAKNEARTRRGLTALEGDVRILLDNVFVLLCGGSVDIPKEAQHVDTVGARLEEAMWRRLHRRNDPSCSASDTMTCSPAGSPSPRAGPPSTPSTPSSEPCGSLAMSASTSMRSIASRTSAADSVVPSLFQRDFTHIVDSRHPIYAAAMYTSYAVSRNTGHDLAFIGAMTQLGGLHLPGGQALQVLDFTQGMRRDTISRREEREFGALTTEAGVSLLRCLRRGDTRLRLEEQPLRHSILQAEQEARGALQTQHTAGSEQVARFLAWAPEACACIAAEEVPPREEIHREEQRARMVLREELQYLRARDFCPPQRCLPLTSSEDTRGAEFTRRISIESEEELARSLVVAAAAPLIVEAAEGSARARLADHSLRGLASLRSACETGVGIFRRQAEQLEHFLSSGAGVVPKPPEAGEGVGGGGGPVAGPPPFLLQGSLRGPVCAALDEEEDEARRLLLRCEIRQRQALAGQWRKVERGAGGVGPQQDAAAAAAADVPGTGGVGSVQREVPEAASPAPHPMPDVPASPAPAPAPVEAAVTQSAAGVVRGGVSGGDAGGGLVMRPRPPEGPPPRRSSAGSTAAATAAPPTTATAKGAEALPEPTVFLTLKERKRREAGAAAGGSAQADLL